MKLEVVEGGMGFRLLINEKFITSISRHGDEIKNLLSVMKEMTSNTDTEIISPDIIPCSCCKFTYGIKEKMQNESFEYKGNKVEFRCYCSLCLPHEKSRFIKCIDMGKEYFDRFTEKERKKNKPKEKRELISKSVRLRILQRDKSTCQMCGSHAPQVKIHIDHITPVSKGGTNDIDNLQCLCEACNLAKSNKVSLHINEAN